MAPRQASSQPMRLDLAAAASIGPSPGCGRPGVVRRPITITTMPENARWTQPVGTRSGRRQSRGVRRAAGGEVLPLLWWRRRWCPNSRYSDSPRPRAHPAFGFGNRKVAGCSSIDCQEELDPNNGGIVTGRSPQLQSTCNQFLWVHLCEPVSLDDRRQDAPSCVMAPPGSVGSQQVPPDTHRPGAGH